jgi:LytS/YehU family sensor histidine kinase
MYSIDISFKIYNEALQKELKLEQARHAQTSMKYDQLSSKLDPHFLFNNLNTLHSLLPENAEKAEEFIVNLSKILRYSLRSGKEELVLIKDELEILRE